MYGPPAVLGYLTLHGFIVPTAPASRKAQGRSASGRNGGARKTTSSNSVVIRIASNDFVVVYEQAVHSIRRFMTNRSSFTAVCVRSSFVPALLGRTQPAGEAVFMRYTTASLATALIHTVHGGAEPRACLTGLRV